MELFAIALAVIAVVYLGYTIARRSRSDKGHGAGGKPGDRDAT
jgi:hypothetical protein